MNRAALPGEWIEQGDWTTRLRATHFSDAPAQGKYVDLWDRTIRRYDGNNRLNPRIP